ncbi:hypothetical protein [Legionella sp.]|uniref:hypothetical protein n=1 Tax=Legionella sp. TaxID=459 RepID=UPI003CBCF4B6
MSFIYIFLKINEMFISLIQNKLNTIDQSTNTSESSKKKNKLFGFWSSTQEEINEISHIDESLAWKEFKGGWID